jgi:mono/diheme cytochrome c family protein
MRTSHLLRRRAPVAASLMVIVACAGTKPTTAAAPAGAPASTPAAVSVAARPAQITDDMVAQGRAIFNNGSCTKCHGPNGAGGQFGPNLAAGNWTHIAGDYDEIVRLVTTGVPKAEVKDPSRRFAMNPRGGMTPPLTDEQVRAVAAYVWTISHQR